MLHNSFLSELRLTFLVHRCQTRLEDTCLSDVNNTSLKDVSDFKAYRSFGEMGVDSMIGIEIKHLLESSLDTTFTVKEIQELKIEDVKTLLQKLESQKSKSSSAIVSTTCTSLPKSFVHPEHVVLLNKVQKGSPIFILDLDCSDTIYLQALGNSVDHPVFALLWTNDTPTSNAESMASWYLQNIRTIVQEKAHIIALSSASVLAFEMLLQDQKKSVGNIQSLTILNGCDALVKSATKETQTKLTEGDIFYEFVEKYIPAPGNTVILLRVV